MFSPRSGAKKPLIPATIKPLTPALEPGEPLSPATPTQVFVSPSYLAQSGIVVPPISDTDYVEIDERETQRDQRRDARQREMERKHQLEEEPIHAEDPAETEQRRAEQQRQLEEDPIYTEAHPEPQFRAVDRRRQPDSVDALDYQALTEEEKDDEIDHHAETIAHVRGEQGIQLTDLSKPFIAVNAKKKTNAEELKEVKFDLPSESEVKNGCCCTGSCSCTKVALHFTSAIAPLAFAMQAAAAAIPDPIEEVDIEKIKSYPWTTDLFACLSGASSEGINYLMNLENIPAAFKGVYHIKDKFTETPGRCVAMVILATGAAIAAGAIGASSFAWVDKAIPALNGGASIFNGCTNLFLYWATRFNGMINISKRRDRYNAQGNFDSLLKRFLNDEHALNELAKTYTDDLNEAMSKIKGGHNIDKEHVHSILKEILLKMRSEDFKIKSCSSAKFFEIVTWAVAVGGALSVAPTFAYKLIDGIKKVEGIVSSSTHVIADAVSDYPFASAVTATVGSLATPLMYLNAISLVPATISGAIEALKEASCGRKVLAGATLLANFLASMSGYNLARSVNKKMPGVFTEGSPFEIFNRWCSAFAVMLVNGKFAIGKVLPAPQTPILRHAKSIRDLPSIPSDAHFKYVEMADELSPMSDATNLKHLAEAAHRWMQANTLGEDALKDLKATEEGTPDGEQERPAVRRERKAEPAPQVLIRGDLSLVDMDEDVFSLLAPTKNSAASHTTKSKASLTDSILPDHFSPSSDRARLSGASFIVQASPARPGVVTVATPAEQDKTKIAKII